MSSHAIHGLACIPSGHHPGLDIRSCRDKTGSVCEFARPGWNLTLERPF